MKGKVYLVGAGPGDTGLVTLYAKELIEKADVVVYDRLINKQILDFAKDACEKIYVGKERGKHGATQRDIETILYKKAQDGKTVVRLKGGDPYLFGRGSEEALFLADKKINFEVIPGVTSAIAGPSYGGIPVTARGIASYVTFVAGHREKESKNMETDWEILSKHSGTIVFLMGVKNLPIICKNLILRGKDKNTPAAVINCATYPYQKKAAGTLSNIAQKAKKAGAAAPSVIIIGDVVNFSSKLDWFSKKKLPLKGKTVLITRAQTKQNHLSRELEKLGARVISFPVIKYTPIKPKNAGKILNKVSEYNYLIFTSSTAIDYSVCLLQKLNLDIRALAGPNICAIGPGTKSSLEKLNLKTAVMPKKFIQEGLLEALKNKNIRGKKILVIRAQGARDALVNGLKTLGAKIDVLNIYKTVLDAPAKELYLETLDAFNNKEITHLVFMSSSQVKNFCEIFKNAAKTPLHRVKCVCIGPETAKTARLFGFKRVAVAKEYSLHGIMKTVIKAK